MSDLEHSTRTPSDATLEKALRKTVERVVKSDNQAELTVKRIRVAVEDELELEPGFFKGDERWKAESEKIIRDEVVRLLLGGGRGEAVPHTLL